MYRVSTPLLVVLVGLSLYFTKKNIEAHNEFSCQFYEKGMEANPIGFIVDVNHI